MPQERNFNITDKRGGAAINVRVVSQSDKAEIAGVINNDGMSIIRVRVTAPSEGDAAANAELVTLLAERLEIEPNRIAIVAGETRRDKIVSIEGLTSGQVDELLFTDPA